MFCLAFAVLRFVMLSFYFPSLQVFMRARAIVHESGFLVRPKDEHVPILPDSSAAPFAYVFL